MRLLITICFLFALSCVSSGSNQSYEFDSSSPGRSLQGMEIKIVSPRYQQLYHPGSNIEVEAEVITHGKTIRQVYASGDGIPKNINEAGIQMQLISQSEDVYRYRYVIENAAANKVYSNVMVQVVDSADEVSVRDQGYLVKELPKVIITSIKDGQILSKNEKIKISMRTNENDYNNTFDVYIDEKSEMEMFYQPTVGGTCFWLSPTPGEHTIQIVVSFDGIELTRSSAVRIIVK
jgi:hypothetical protein